MSSSDSDYGRNSSCGPDGSETRQIWQRADCVCFDVDSTVIQEEGLDGLAEFLAKGEEVRAITLQAMGGGLSFQEALTRRLDILRPSRAQVTEFSKVHPFTLTPGVQEVIAKLHSRHTAVYLISGGFSSLIEPVAAELNIPAANLYCNDLQFDENGEYAGFDLTRFTSKSGGKGRAIEHIMAQKSYKSVVMIGDGATDMEACPPAHAFIGFGGNVVRRGVKEAAKWYVLHFSVLTQSLDAPPEGDRA